MASEKRCKYSKQYRQKNKEKIREYQKKWYQENKHKVKKRTREYYYNNKESCLETQQKYYQRNKQKIQEYKKFIQHRYYKKGKIRKKARRIEIKEQLFAIYGKKCSICGFDNKQALTFDHIKGDGAKERKNLSQEQIYLSAIEKPNYENYRILCANCQMIEARRLNLYSTCKKNTSNKKTIYGRVLYERKKKTFFEIYGNKCVLCGFNDKQALTLDHIKGDGAQERAKNTHSQIISLAIKTKNKTKYRILCMNCQMLEARRLGLFSSSKK